jgi:hypothetical protein
MVGSEVFMANMPTKWISNEGKDFHLIFSGSGRKDPGHIAYDAYQQIKGSFVLK